MKRPNKKQVNEYLGKNVTITMFDGDVVEGILQTTESDFERYGHRGFYHVGGNLIFRSSHIIEIRSNEESIRCTTCQATLSKWLLNGDRVEFCGYCGNKIDWSEK
jgi:DNA-directed RNA polymerase subunit RPC12/RpoP